MKKKVTKKRVVRKTEAVVARVVKVRSNEYDGDFEAFELTDKVLRDSGQKRAYRRSITFRDLAITLANLAAFKNQELNVKSVRILGKAGNSEFVAWGVSNDSDAKALWIGCQYFTGKNYDRILKAVAKTGLYSVV